MNIMKLLAGKARDNWNAGPVTIAFLGDSVTQGCFEVFLKEGNCETVFDQEHSYVAYVSKILSVLYPNVPVSIINAGISGDNAANGMRRLERDVLRFRPDLTVVCFGLNDCGGGLEHAKEYEQSLRDIFRRLKEAGGEVIYMTPNRMNTYVDQDALKEPLLIEIAEHTGRIQREGILDAYLTEGKRAAAECGIPVCDVNEKWNKLYQCKVDTTGLLVNHINHPSREMNWLFAWSLLETMAQESV